MEKSFNKIIDLLYLAKQDGVEVVLIDERLQFKIAENTLVDENLIKEIRNNKQLIIDYLNSDNWKIKSINNNHNKIERFERDLKQTVTLSFSQERLWFIDQLEGSVQYHTPFILRLKGNLDESALTHSLKMVIERHEILRTVFHEENGKVYQTIKDAGTWQLPLEEATQYHTDSTGLKAYIESLVKAPFDLSADYPVRG
ncbi:MAG: condensation domain-containing protein, partial [Ferruginibacter sp.]